MLLLATHSKHLMKGLLCTLLIVLVAPSGRADDAFECCMPGLKSVGQVELCAAPCCPGYTEVREQHLILDSLVLCKKTIKSAEQLVRHNEWANSNRYLYWQRK